MVNQQLFDFIKQQLQQGISQEQIKSSLIANGWQEADITEAFNLISNPTSSPQSFSPLSQQPKRKISKTLLAIISIIGVLIIGGGIFGYFYYFYETPEKVIEKMDTRLTEVKTLEYQGDISFIQPTQQTPSKKVDNFSVNFNGKSDISDLNNPKMSFVFNIKTDELKGLTQEKSAFDLEIKIINKVVYIKLDNLSKLEFPDLSVLSNQWIKIDTKTIEEIIKELRELEKLINETLKELFEIKRIELLTPKQTTIKWAKLLKVTEKLASEKIEGVNTYHYKFLIDKNEFKKLAVDIYKGLAEFDKELEEAIDLISGEIWIGKKDYLPYKVIFTIREKTDAVQLTTATLLFKNYNKPMQIDIPSPVKNFEEIKDQLLYQLFFGETDKRVRDAKRHNDIRQIQAGIERYYMDHNSYPLSLDKLPLEYLAEHLSSIPVDPLTNQPYQYQLQQDKSDYKVCAQLESTKTQKCVP